MSGDPYERLHEFLPEIDELGIPGYETIRPIGEGGFGRVFLARQVAFGRDVAVKVLASGSLKDDAAKRFERECRAIGALSGHPNIVAIYDCGMTPWGRPYIVMEYMSGGSLGDIIGTSGPLPWQDAVAIVIEMCGAVDAAHQVEILHRDIKPENILLSTYGDPKLADFGVASVPGGYQTQTGAITASLAHAAPEVLDGLPPTSSIDIYSLGSTLFTLITGRAPFMDEGAGLQTLIARTMTQPIPDLRPGGTPDPVCSAIEIAMAKQPEQRFSGAKEMARSLQAAQGALGKRPTAIPEQSAPVDHPGPLPQLRTRVPGPIPRIEKPVKRRRTSRGTRQRIAPLAAMAVLIAAATVGAFAARPDPRADLAAEQEPGPTVEVPDTVVESPASVEQDRSPHSSNRKDHRGQTEHRSRAPARERGTILVSAAGGAIESLAHTEGGPSSPAGGSDARPASDGGGGNNTSPPDRVEPHERDGTEEVANLVLYHHWNEDNGRYFYTTDPRVSFDQMGYYDYREVLGHVWSRSRIGDGLTQLCFSNTRCEGWVARERPDNGSARPLYWHPGGAHGRYFTTDPTANFQGAGVSLYGWIRP